MLSWGFGGLFGSALGRVGVRFGIVMLQLFDGQPLYTERIFETEAKGSVERKPIELQVDIWHRPGDLG